MSTPQVGWSQPYPNPIISITTDHPLPRFRYTPDFSACDQNTCPLTVTITLTGSRPKDFVLCNQAADLPKTPAGYTWHHKYMAPHMMHNRCDMQLVKTATHRASCCHLGGFGQYISEDAARSIIADHFSVGDEIQDCLFQQAEFVSAEQGELAAPAISTSALERTTQDLGLVLPSALEDFYRSGHKLTPGIPFLEAMGCTYLVSTLYPLVKGMDTTETVDAIITDESQRPGGSLLFARDGAIPIADDPFGNVYFLPSAAETSVYFYDHEADYAFNTYIPLQHFLEQLSM